MGSQVAIINESTVVTDAQISAMVSALQTQVSDHFAPIWGRDAQLSFLPTGSTPPLDKWWLAILDTSDQAGALGYHETTDAGLPCGKVFAQDDIANGSSLSVTISHELLEMLGNPFINLCAIDPNASQLTNLFMHEMCDPCFVEGSMVQTPGGPVPIESLNIGDTVIDKDGLAQRVQKAWCEGFPKETLLIKLWGGRELRLTPNHKTPVWAWPRECACGCREAVVTGRSFLAGHAGGVSHKGVIVPIAAKLTIGGNTTRGLPIDYKPMKRMRADEVRPRDYLMIPRRFEAIQPKESESFARLLGYYAAEGDVMAKKKPEHQDYVRFSFNSTEHETWAKDVCDLALSEGFESKVYLYERSQGASANRCSVHLKAPSGPFVAHAAQGSATKAFSSEVMAWPIDYKRELIRGLFRGDGWRGRVGASRAFIVEYVTTSPRLASQTELILAQLGFACSISRKPAHIWRDGYKRAESFHLRITSDFAREMARLVWGDEIPATRTGRNKPWLDENYVYIPVKSVEHVPSLRRVFNLTVADSHSYLVDNIGTFNCEDDSLGYQIGGIQVSDFVLPSWFEPNPAGETKFSFNNKLAAPLSLATGGYMSVYDITQNQWLQKTANQQHPAAMQALRAVAAPGTRKHRIAHRALVWRKSMRHKAKV
jgi:hypothetical protein